MVKVRVGNTCGITCDAHNYSQLLTFNNSWLQGFDSSYNVLWKQCIVVVVVHLLPSRAWKFPWRHSCSDLVDVPRIVSGPAAWQVTYAISLWYRSKPSNHSVVKVANQFGKDLCTEGKFQLLLYSTRAALPTLPIDGCYKGLTLHHPLKPCHSCNSGDKCNCQNIKSFFAV